MVIFPPGEMVAEEEAWEDLAELWPRAGLVLRGSRWVWESLLLSEAAPAPGTAENPPRGGPVKTTTKETHPTLWGDFKANWKAS